MKENTTTDELKALELQLNCPQGEMGKEVGKTMHTSNLNMTLTTFESLQLSTDETLVELGHGNGAHLEHLLHQRPDLQYRGFEVSTTMYEEATRINKRFIENGVAQYSTFDGINIPQEAESADAVLTVNTLYFWQDPQALLADIYRVLKPGGLLAIGYAQKDFMQQLPFVGDTFRLYGNEEMEQLMALSPFDVLRLFSHTERAKSKTGEDVLRKFTVAVVNK